MHILILQLKRIGDLILTTPVVHTLRQSKPNAKITIVTIGPSATLLDAITANQKFVFELPLGGINFWQSFLSQRYDVCLDFTGNDRSALLALLSRAQRRITYQRFRNRFLRRFIYTEFINSSVRDRHTVDYHLDLLLPLGCKAQGLSPSLSLPDEARRRIHRWLEAQRIQKPFAVVHPGTARKEKFWMPERWSEVITDLNSRGYQVLMTGTLTPEEQAHRNAIKNALSPHSIPHSALRTPHFIDCLGTFSLVELAALLEQAALLCSVDSAPVHLADAIGIPVIALFGPTNPFHWRPRSAQSLVVQPNSTVISPNASTGQMVDISASAVCEAIARFIR